ncbi:hypothetical protein [Streptomyces broussonetiae]|uniref:Uncharacterized protein n=1 Tax=Streptomyces broussonetiae TaxID=2686304 RepID=A0A6I6N468_9ACTN|nr:hypothetical protein [Streptomyces broussonetiae]QHA06244.1 hypothetical protein GQF42_25815 [Streptomyces broussonetiae]
MSAKHTKYLFVASAVGILLASGADIGMVGTAHTASGTTLAHFPSYSHRSSRGCDEVWGDGGCDVEGDHGGFGHDTYRGDGPSHY